MIISLSFNNCLIYNEQVDFTMRANMHYKRFASNVHTSGNTNILKSAVILGPNNTGKSNFVNAISTLKSIMLNGNSNIENNLFSNNPICELSVTFLHEGKEYVFEVKYNVFTKEYIYERFAEIVYDVHKNKREDNLILRDNANGEYSSENQKLSSIMEVTAKNNILIYLLDTEQFEDLKTIKEIMVSFAGKIEIIDMNNIPIKKTIELLKSSNSMRQKIVKFILNADLSLEDYRYLTDDEVEISVEKIKDGELRPQENALMVSNPVVEMLHLASVYNGVAVPSLLFDSTGTKKIAGIASYVIDAIENGKILIVDELDNSLHFTLTRSIITLFNNELNNKAQLICTAHDVSLLDCNKLFRKEQIWFTHKDKERAYLYSLSDFTAAEHGVRDTSDLIEKYKKGVFGAIPEPDLFETLLGGDENA